MKRCLIFCAALMLTLTASAIDPQLKRINNIKLDTTYIYVDVTMPTMEQAKELAYVQLQQDVQKWAKQAHVILPDDINSLAETITSRRDDQYRFFAFINKEKLQNKPQGKQVPPVPQEESALDRIKKVHYDFELKQMLESLKQRGEIKEYGKYSTIKNPEQCHLIIYDEAGNVRALLGPGTTERKNLLTNQPDSLKNYRGSRADWFILK